MLGNTLRFVVLIIGLFPTIARADKGFPGDLHWRSIGPANSGGRVAAVAGTNADPLLYYIGAADGGVFRTSNGGVTWDDLWHAQPVAAIGALAIAPSDSRVVWVGTGESKPRNDASFGDGIWFSRDGGQTWLHRGLEASYSISRILVSGRSPQRAIVGALGNPFRDSTERGVYVTSDAGLTWRKTLYVGPRSGVADLAWDPRDERVVFAAIWQLRRVPWSFDSGGPLDGIWRSADGGQTWRRLIGRGLPAGLMGRIGLAVAPSDPRRVYVLIQSRAGVLWRSDDSGLTWQLVNNDSALNQRPFYMSRLEVDPRNADHVFFLSEDLFESFDGGRTFRRLVNSPHQDHHALWIASNGTRMIEGDDGGAPISLDGGTTWEWRYNISIGQIYRLALDHGNPYRVCGGFQDNDSFCGPSDSLDPLGYLAGYWRDVGNDSDGTWVVPDVLDSNVVWNAGIDVLTSELTLYDSRTRASHDISPYVHDTTGAPLEGLPYRFNWESPVAISPLDPHVVYFGGNVVFRTDDYGAHWTPISPDLTRNEPAHQQVAGGPINTDVSGAEFYDTLLTIAPSPLDASVIWAGADDGLIHVTRDGGGHWSNVTPAGLLPYGRVENIDPSPYDSATAFAAVDRHYLGDREPHAFQTRDYGQTWQNISAGLPRSQYLHVVRQDPIRKDILYAGLEQGIWISFDAGAHWQSLQGDLPVTAVRDLRVAEPANDLVVATHGRGFFILDDLTPLQQKASNAVALYPPRTAFNYYRWWYNFYGTGRGEGIAPQQLFVGENAPVGAIISFYLPRSAQAAPRLEILDANGHIVRTLLGGKHAGINRLAWNLTEEPPHSWHSAKQWNQGSSDGAIVVPGDYLVRLYAGDRNVSQPLRVSADPRASWTQEDYEARYGLLHSLNDELSAIDDCLNFLDSKMKRKPLDARSRALYGALTSNPRNSEDTLFRPDRLREYIQSLQVTMSLSQGPPTTAQLNEAGEIKAAFDAHSAECHKVR